MDQLFGRVDRSDVGRAILAAEAAAEFAIDEKQTADVHHIERAADETARYGSAAAIASDAAELRRIRPRERECI